MHEPRRHGVNYEQQQDNPEAEEEITKGTRDILPLQPLIAYAVAVQCASRNQTVIPAPAVMEHFRFGNPPGENDRVHRELLNAEMGVKEMDREDKSGGQQGFVRMNDKREVDYPAR